MIWNKVKYRMIHMMKKNLAMQNCVPCRGGTPPMTDLKIQEFLQYIDGWNQIEEDGNKKIMKEFIFNDFGEAMYFVNIVAEMAENEDHHPDIFIQWNRVTFILWTHAIEGLHENDFIIAAKIDAIKAQRGPSR